MNRKQTSRCNIGYTIDQHDIIKKQRTMSSLDPLLEKKRQFCITWYILTWQALLQLVKNLAQGHLLLLRSLPLSPSLEQSWAQQRKESIKGGRRVLRPPFPVYIPGKKLFPTPLTPVVPLHPRKKGHFVIKKRETVRLRGRKKYSLGPNASFPFPQRLR